MRIFAISRRLPGVTSDDVAPYKLSEAAFAWRMHREGFIRDIYWRVDEAGGAVLVLESASLEAARAQLAQLPMVGKVIEFELLPVGYFLPFDQLMDEQALAAQPPL